jgi:hypothetical protein
VAVARSNVPNERFRPIVVRELAARRDRNPDGVPVKAKWEGALTQLARELAASTGRQVDSWERRLRAVLTGVESGRNGRVVPKGTVELETVDRFLTALGLVELWYTELADLYVLDGEVLEEARAASARCVSCGEVLGSRGDSRVGDRCSLCFARQNRGWRLGPWTRDELLRLYVRYVREQLTVAELVAPLWQEKGYRTADAGEASVRHAWHRNGWPVRRRGESKHLRRLRTGPQLSPRRKLHPGAARALHRLHWNGYVSINQLARTFGPRLGLTQSACCSQLSYTWKLLGLPVHDRIEMTVRASTRNGLSPRDWKERRRLRLEAGLTVKGHERQPRCQATSRRTRKRCTRPSLEGRDVCASHAPEKQAATAARLAEMRARSPLHDPNRLEPLAPLQEEMRAYYEWAGRGAWNLLAEVVPVKPANLSRLSRTTQQWNVDRQVARQIRDAIAELTRPALAA